VDFMFVFSAMTARLTLLLPSIALLLAPPLFADDPEVFGQKFPKLDGLATGDWWTLQQPGEPKPGAKPPKRRPKKMLNLNVPRDEVIGFGIYTHDRGILKLTAQLFPLKPDEAQEVRLEFKRGNKWMEAAREDVMFPGWSAHFRIEKWNNTADVPYRLRHGEKAVFEGLIRKDPIEKDEIVIGNLSCNSSRTSGARPQIVKNLLVHDPDLIFFAGDQTYHHTQHTAGWLEFGLQFRDLIRDRPCITIPDDHDVGQGNIWGENGKKAASSAGPTGGYFYPARYINMVQRCQTWHLPDPYDAQTIQREITVYYTNLRVGGIDFAILEDRKFKSGPKGKIPKMGPRPDHINDPKYNRKSVDVKGLKLLGERQLKFLHQWGQDWTGSFMKCVLSQTAFCGAVHKHGSPNNRLLADLDSNAWPQTGRNKALREIRRAWAPHLCGDQHLAVTVKHGIDEYGDGPYGFTSPALVNTIYGRWWHPANETAGPNAVPKSPLPWTGDYEDGLGNKISMLAYANPEDRSNERKRADGYGVVRFKKSTREVTFECYKRFTDVTKDQKSSQFPGWPIKFHTRANDGRKVFATLPKITVPSLDHPVYQVIEDKTGEILYTARSAQPMIEAQVYAPGKYTVKAGKDKPEEVVLKSFEVPAK
jgi:hypothetical protein